MDLSLHNFTYDAIAAGSPVDAQTRLRWLDKQVPALSGKDGEGQSFSPQPWLRLKKVLQQSGHMEQARRVGIALEERRRHCGKIGEYDQGAKWFQKIHSGFVRSLHRLFGVLAGYGYRPFKLLYWTIGLWLACSLVYTYAAYAGAFAPSETEILQDPHLLAACSPTPPDAPPEPQHNWYLCSALPREYPGFHPWVYSLNVLLPVVDLQQEQAWGPVAPPASRLWWKGFVSIFMSLGGWAQLLVWLETLYGWIAGAMLIAVVTGLTRKEEEE
jgi:hypothetical protein